MSAELPHNHENRPVLITRRRLLTGLAASGFLLAVHEDTSFRLPSAGLTYAFLRTHLTNFLGKKGLLNITNRLDTEAYINGLLGLPTYLAYLAGEKIKKPK